MAAGPIALLFGGMVVVVTLGPTGLFDYIGTRYLMATGGSGKRFLLGLVLLIAPLCAVLPNATTVILLAPIIIRVANALEVDFVGPMVLTAVISNSAGMLTLVGDPATFLVGSEVGMSFMQYLRRVSPGALLTILVILPLIPRLFKDTWQVRRTLPDDLKPEPLKDPVYAAVSIVVLVLMVLLFLFGEKMPFRLLPPGASIVAASLSFLVLHGIRHETVDSALKKNRLANAHLSHLHVQHGGSAQADRDFEQSFPESVCVVRRQPSDRRPHHAWRDCYAVESAGEYPCCWSSDISGQGVFRDR
jgi:Na+/H+ antiporter NhaD/arsenite permease-like protein